MKIKRIIAMILLVPILCPYIVMAESGLTESQKAVADKVANTVSDNWEEYGVLPSVAVAQTLVESSLGEHQVRPNNLWGLRPGGNYRSYDSLDDGIHGYLRVIGEPRYKRARFVKDYETQISRILDGGYYGEDDGGTISGYYNHVVSSIRKYGFDKYDEKLFNRIDKETEEKRIAKWSKTYTVIYDPDLKPHEVSVDKSIIHGGAVQIWKNEELQGIYDVVGGQKGCKLGVSDIRLDGLKVKIVVDENAKG